ncbi:uncharacterized protein EAF01_010097 [Botrytis porri]|uniref:Transmembrane protein 135 N-terminal domain-containing protein n=1 Tax=Botrytis porri TaxID=87229 RepID=A0A4Z1KAT7_9HELO|nr:uncharacterized protein EAF01_010097 [Botrytis porri]KAF7894647.1 hypothetical protein EAF01_010097 [Botrytis porri]TGO82760.1 hypothetical protein BPOR_0764g00010 [Botrytis porri]
MESAPNGAPEAPKPPRDRISAKSTADPILRNAIRYTISAKEYETLHKYIISRSKVLKRNAPTVTKVEKLVERPGRDDYNAAAVRGSLRLFLATNAGLKIWSLITEKFMGAGKAGGKKMSLWKSPNFRLSLSLSTILLFHRILFRFFTRLRAHLLTSEAEPFRQRNPKTSKTLTSSLAPAVGASLAGFMLGVYPGDQLRVTIAIYALSRAAEISYNLAEEEGWIWGKEGSRWERPWWWGSWLLFPLTCGQLLHAFVFDRDCFPKQYGDFILKNSPQYIQTRPEDYPANLPWPNTYSIVDNLAEMARLNYPPFVSPILFPNNPTLPQSLSSISPITSPAHPLITSLTCATLHPSDPSCLRTYLTYWIQVFPRLARVFTLILSLFSLPSYRKFYNSPISSLNTLAIRILKSTLYISGAIGTSWASICAFQSILPRHVLPTQRFFLGGALGGLWGFVVRKDARGEFLYSARASMDSLWKVGKKRGWWKGIKGGDVWIFVISLMAIEMVYERDGRALRSGMLRKILSGMRGEGWRDYVTEEEKRLKEEKKL